MANRTLFAPDGSEINRGNDLKVDNRKKLGQYLSDRTSGRPSPSDDPDFSPNDYQYTPRKNDFPIDGTTNEELRLSDGNRKYSLPEVSSVQPTFAGKTEVDRWSRSNDSENVGWKKTTFVDSDGDEQNKRRVLYGMAGGNPGQETNEYSSKLRDGVNNVLKHNAFTQDRKFTSRKGDSTVQNWPAESSSQKIAEMRDAALKVLGYSAGRNDSEGTDFGPLARAGQMINLTPDSVKKGISGFRYSTNSTYSSFDDQPVEAGPKQGFDGVPLQYAGTSNINIPYPDDGLGTTGGIYSGFSYGNKNDADTPFGNLAKAPESILFALAAAAAIFVAITVWSAVLALIFYKLDRPEYRTGTNPSGSERDTSVVSDLLSLLFGTKRPYNVNTLIAGFEGVISFLGVDIGPSGAASAVTDAVINFAFSPDYYMLICRMVLNGVYSFAGQVTGGGGGGPAGAVTALANLRSNKLVSFVNRMVDIGSISLRGVETTTDIEPGGNDAYYSQAIHRVARSRQSGNKLSWRNSSTAMTLLSPGVIVGGSSTFYYGKPNIAKLWADRIAKRVEGFEKAQENNSQIASSIESKLNAEYVPFYFRDLRTDEIISFHAFLGDLSDSFNASYTTSDGFGRQDPVQMYKGTSRSIGFSFHVVSTSPKDHDIMWYKINKLVSLLYPQYTDGIKVTDSKNNVFEVPFSQVYGASPLIRLRIGDVIASNYSRFGLARLFGLGKSGNVFADGKNGNVDIGSIAEFSSLLKPTSITTKTAEDNINGIAPADTGKQSDNVFDPISLLFPDNANGRVIRGGVFRGVVSNKGVFDRTYAIHIRPGTLCTIPKVPKVPLFTDNYFLKQEIGNKSVSLVKITPGIKVKPRDIGNDEITINYVYIPYELLEFTVEAPAVDPLGLSIDALPESEPENLTNKFFSPKTNSIVQSFESSMGQGLAGVITSLSMDWNESTWETDKLGGKAPLWLKITMQFSPIHDLPMGLDSTGVQIAPAYPVGDLSRRMSGIDVEEKDGTVTAGYTSNVETDAPIKVVESTGRNTDELGASRYKKRFI